MRLETQFHPNPPSDRLLTAVHDSAARLDTLRDDIAGCRIAVQAPRRRPHSGMGQWKVDLHVVMRGERRGPHTSSADINVYAAVGAAFDGAAARLARRGPADGSVRGHRRRGA